MFVYRAFERLGLTHITDNKMVNYCLIAVLTIVGAVAVAFCWGTLQKRIQTSFGKMKIAFKEMNRVLRK